MKIKSFQIREITDFNWKKIDLDEDVCIFYSTRNSTGKTTLMRAILYSMGFSVPNTELVKFEKYEFRLTLYREKEYIIFRKGMFITVNNIEYDLPMEQTTVLSIIFGTTNPEILSNLLGTFYFDQEKGWTLLNRGTIIGTNRFSIESFFRGLKGDESIESYEIVARISSIEKKIAQYNLMINIAEYQDIVKQEGGNSLDYKTYDKTLDIELDDLKLQLSDVEAEISRISEIIKTNKNFSDYIEQKKIYVKNPQDPSTPIPVTKSTLLDYQDFDDLNKARRDLLMVKRNGLKKEIAKIQSEQKKQIRLINLPTIDESLTAKLANIEGINSVQIIKLRDSLQKQKKELSTILTNKTKTNNPWIKKAYDIINKYAQELSIPFDYKIDIFTKNLKAKSGAILHKMVFIYKLAYISLLSEVLQYPIPIFCDSPSGREVEKSTIDGMLNILKRDYSHHQLVLASIYKYSEIFPKAKIIETNGTLFNKQTLFD